MKGDKLVVHLFTKNPCSLCVPVKNLLIKHQESLDYDVKIVDIETSQEEDAFLPSDEQKKQAMKEMEKIKRIEPNYEPLQDSTNHPWFRFAYKYHIPVVTVNGVEISRHILDEDSFLSCIHNELQEKE